MATKVKFIKPVDFNNQSVTNVTLAQNQVQNLPADLQNIREVAEGKSKAFVLSYADVAPTAETFGDNKYVKYPSNEVIATFEEFTTYTAGAACGNSRFNSEENLIFASGYILARTSISGLLAYYVIPFNYYWEIFKTGDIFLITETDVPDRWWDSGVGAGDGFWKLETSKIDLTNYATISYVDTKIQAEASRAIAIENTKLDKNTTASKSVYGVKEGVQNMYGLTNSNPGKDKIPVYTSTGTLKVTASATIADNDAASKYYVDNTISAEASLRNAADVNLQNQINTKLDKNGAELGEGSQFFVSIGDGTGIATGTEDNTAISYICTLEGQNEAIIEAYSDENNASIVIQAADNATSNTLTLTNTDATLEIMGSASNSIVTKQALDLKQDKIKKAVVQVSQIKTSIGLSNILAISDTNYNTAFIKNTPETISTSTPVNGRSRDGEKVITALGTVTAASGSTSSTEPGASCYVTTFDADKIYYRIGCEVASTLISGTIDYTYMTGSTLEVYIFNGTGFTKLADTDQVIVTYIG